MHAVMCLAFFLPLGKGSDQWDNISNKWCFVLQCTFLKSRGTSESQGLSALKSSLRLDFMLVHG